MSMTLTNPQHRLSSERIAFLKKYNVVVRPDAFLPRISHHSNKREGITPPTPIRSSGADRILAIARTMNSFSNVKLMEVAKCSHAQAKNVIHRMLNHGELISRGVIPSSHGRVLYELKNNSNLRP